MRIDALERATSSETVLPVAKAARNRAFIRWFLGLADWVQNCGCSSMDSAMFGFRIHCRRVREDTLM